MKIALLGDIALFGKYTKNNEKILSYFYDVAALFKQYDYVVGNLETPFINDGKPFGPKSAHICSDEINVELLKYLNINIVNLANNHIFDYGLRGYENTKKILKENNINYFGIENLQHLIIKDQNKVALCGYCCYSTNGLGFRENSNEIGVNVLDGFEVEETLLENSSKGYLSIMSVHAGQEHVNYPNPDHIEMARLLAERVSYIYYGHHPHVVQGVEERGNSLLAYSLGNFCFDDVYTSKSTEPLIHQTDENRKSLIVSLVIEDNKIMSYDLITMFLGEDKATLFPKDINEDIEKYSQTLKLPLNEINIKRKYILQNYYSERKKARDFNWYLKRLNYRSLLILWNAKRNAKKYTACVTQYNRTRG